MRRSIRQIREERRFLSLLVRLSIFEEPKHTVRKVLGRVESLSRNFRDILVRDLVGAFRIEWRKHLYRRGSIFKEWFVQVLKCGKREGVSYETFSALVWVTARGTGEDVQWLPAPGSRLNTFSKPRA